MVTVWYQGEPTYLFREVAEQFNLHSGDELQDEKQRMIILAVNAEYALALYSIRK